MDLPGGLIECVVILPSDLQAFPSDLQARSDIASLETYDSGRVERLPMIDTKERNKLLKLARKLRQNAEINRSHASDLRFSARNKRKQAEDIGLQLFPWSERAFHNDKDRATHSRLEEEALNLKDPLILYMKNIL